MIINNRPVCEPILSLVEILMKNGCFIEKQVLNDYHFDEMLFILKAPEKFSVSKEELPPEINEDKPNYFTCNCHWSIVEVI